MALCTDPRAPLVIITLAPRAGSRVIDIVFVPVAPMLILIKVAGDKISKKEVNMYNLANHDIALTCLLQKKYATNSNLSNFKVH